MSRIYGGAIDLPGEGGGAHVCELDKLFIEFPNKQNFIFLNYAGRKY